MNQAANPEQIYLDSHATTRVDQDVLQMMLPFFTEHYGNGNHIEGWQSAAAVERARFQVSSIIGAKPDDLVFTSGATEAINMALLGVTNNHGGGRRHIISQKTEHAAVLQCLEQLRAKGYKITLLDVDDVGRISVDQLKATISEDTLLVAIMLANNEIGTVQPIKEIGTVCREQGVLFFCDLTQGIGWHKVDVGENNIDLAAFSSHKIYGPRGAGALYHRRINPKIKLKPILFGGGQEKGLRSGTVNLPAIVGFGKACEMASENLEENTFRIKEMRDLLQSHVFSALSDVSLNGCPVNKHPGNLNINIPFISGEELGARLPHLIFSKGSACASASSGFSHVLAAINDNKTQTDSSIRIGVGKFNTPNEISLAAQSIVQIALELQSKRKNQIY